MPFFGGGGAAVANMGGATSSAAGTAGLVPAPSAGKKTRGLFSNAAFEEIPFFPLRKAANTLWVSSKIFGVGASVQNQTPAARRRQFGLGFFPDDGNIDTLGARIAGTAPSPATNIHLGLWECGEDGLPSTIIVGGTASSGTSANTDISIAVSSTAVKRGYFYFSLTLEASTGAWNGNSATAYGFASSINGVEANPASSGNSPYYVATTYDQTTHGTFLFDGSGIAQVSYQWA